MPPSGVARRRSDEMRRSLIQYRTAPERADENERLIKEVFAELAAKSPPGLGYLVLRAGDGNFFHLVANAGEAGSPITALDAFKAFQSGIRERCIDPPEPRNVTIVGNYRMLAEG
jgi:hypothetical protein